MVVKNPSCEWVEVKNISIKVVKGYNNNGEIDCYHTNGYEIIIPQEEPKTVFDQLEVGKEYKQEVFELGEKPKQETLEEPKKSFGEIWSSLTAEQSEYLKDYINKQIDKAKKWQAERMYSEEEVLELLLSRPGPYLTDEEIKEWFKQIKKK